MVSRSATETYLLYFFQFILYLILFITTYAFGQIQKSNIQIKPETDEVVLSFKEVEITEVISAFSKTMRKPFLLDPRVKGRLNLEAPEPISIDKAYQMLISALSLSGFSVLEEEGFIKILPSADAKTKGGKVFLSNENPSGGLITKVFTLEHDYYNLMQDLNCY